MPVRVVLTDIEGTVGSVSFVKDVLFPYARDRLPSFLAETADTPEVAPLLAEARTLAGLAAVAPVEAVAAVLDAWIEADRKAPPLKALQGLIWRGGYEAGTLKAHVYLDAVTALNAWHAAGVPLYVYSSGSVEAQLLFFAHTVEGDLTPLFQGYFDTRTGPKAEAASYARIAEVIGAAPQDILFLSDTGAELVAARHAGMQVIGLGRDGILPQGAEDVRVVGSFADIALDAGAA